MFSDCSGFARGREAEMTPRPPLCATEAAVSIQFRCPVKPESVVEDRIAALICLADENRTLTDATCRLSGRS
jgi:hypothetical protein